jgi:hypothetical protein
MSAGAGLVKTTFLAIVPARARKSCGRRRLRRHFVITEAL